MQQANPRNCGEGLRVSGVRPGQSLVDDLGLLSVHFLRVDFVRDLAGLLAGLGFLAALALTLGRALETCERLAEEVAKRRASRHGSKDARGFLKAQMQTDRKVRRVRTFREALDRHLRAILERDLLELIATIPEDELTLITSDGASSAPPASSSPCTRTGSL
jgi:hypothetical protein